MYQSLLLSAPLLLCVTLTPAWSDVVPAGSGIERGEAGFDHDRRDAFALTEVTSRRSDGTRSVSDGGARPAAPSALRVAVYSATAVGLAWARGTAGVVHEVRRDGASLGTRDGTSYVDDTLTGGRDYRYEVIAIDAAGRRSTPASILVRTARAPVKTPASPAGLRATRYSGTALGLAWTRATVPGLRYRVEREGRLLALTDGTSHVDRDLLETKSYEYTVSAIDADGRRSTPASVVVPPAGPLPVPRGLRARIYSSTAVELFWRGGRRLVTEIRRDGVPLGTAGYGYAFSDFDVGTPMPRYEVVFVDTDGTRSAPAVLAVDMSTPEREVGAFGAGPDPSPRPPPSRERFPPTAAPVVAFDFDGSNRATARLFDDIDVRLEGATLLWDRVPNATRYRVRTDGEVSDIDVEQRWTTLYLGSHSPGARYTVTALDAGGGVLGQTRFLVDYGLSPPLFPPDDALGDAGTNPLAQASSSGRTTLERLGFDATRELADELLAGRYLESYFEVADTVDGLIADVVRDYFEDPGRLAGNLADDGGLPADVACPGGGQLAVEALGAARHDPDTLHSKLAFDACRLADRVLSGRLSREVVRYPSEQDGTFTVRRIELDAFGVDAGERGRFVANGMAKLSANSDRDDGICEDGRLGRRSLLQELVQSVFERDGMRHTIDRGFHYDVTGDRDRLEGDGTCRPTELHEQQGYANVRSPDLGGSVRLSRSIDLDPSTLLPNGLSAGQFKADFGDGSRFAISYLGTDDTARVDLASGERVVSFRDTVPFR